MKCLMYIFALVLTEAYAQTIGFGGCPQTATKANFDVAQFSGKWYEQFRMFNAYEMTGICQTFNISTTGTNFTLVNKQLDALVFGDKILTGSGPISNAKATLNIAGFPIPFSFTIIDTDYTKYASAYACADFFIIHIKYAWVLTRERFPANTITDQALSVFSANQIPSSGFNKTEQFWCPIGH